MTPEERRQRSKELYARDDARLKREFEEAVAGFGNHRGFYIIVTAILCVMAYFA